MLNRTAVDLIRQSRSRDLSAEAPKERRRKRRREKTPPHPTKKAAAASLQARRPSFVCASMTVIRHRLVVAPGRIGPAAMRRRPDGFTIGAVRMTHIERRRHMATEERRINSPGNQLTKQNNVCHEFSLVHRASPLRLKVSLGRTGSAHELLCLFTANPHGTIRISPPI